MLDVTWEWIAIDKAALDVANTVAAEKGVEHDLLASDPAYQRWAAAAAHSSELMPVETAALASAQAPIVEMRKHIRALFHATAAGEPLPEAAVARLNKASRAAPHWPELGTNHQIEQIALGDPVDRLLARYARSAMEIAADGRAKLRVCGAPSCGMFYRPRRGRQRWCSEPCGNRARFARHYRAHRRTSSRSRTRT
jgi:predicted RNA-binding Zn ribbon-like protein